MKKRGSIIKKYMDSMRSLDHEPNPEIDNDETVDMNRAEFKRLVI